MVNKKNSNAEKNNNGLVKNGYVQLVTPLIYSLDRNPHYDVVLSSAGDTFSVIRVLKASSTIKRDFFVKKQLDEKPISVSNLTDNEEKSLFFFNPLSSVENHGTLKKFSDGSHVLTVSEAQKFRKPFDKTKRFAICGMVLWRGDKQLRRCKKNAKAYLREGVLDDGSGKIQIGVWGDKIDAIHKGETYKFTCMRMSDVISGINDNHPVITTTSETMMILVPSIPKPFPKMSYTSC